jgi:nucleoside-diphosphate-sugar epimerase
MGSKKNINVLVTGGGGFVGFALISRLIEHGYSVSSFSRQHYTSLSDLGINQIIGDLQDYDSVRAALKNQKTVFHVAAKAGYWGPYRDYHNCNVLGTQNIIRSCKENKVENLIFTSSASVVFAGRSIENGKTTLPYPRKPLNAYTATKALAEEAVLLAASDLLKTISLRPHIIWGPGDRHLFPRILARAKSGKLKIIGNRKNIVDTVFIDNLIDAHILAMDALNSNHGCSGKAYFITNNEPVNLWNFINKLLVKSGHPIAKKSIPTWLAMGLSHLIGILHLLKRPNREPKLTPFIVKELSQSHWFDISESIRDLNYTPKISLDDGLLKLFNK